MRVILKINIRVLHQNIQHNNLILLQIKLQNKMNNLTNLIINHYLIKIIKIMIY